MEIKQWIESGNIKIRKFPETPEGQKQLQAELAKAAIEIEEMIRELEESKRTTHETMQIQFDI